LDQCRCQRAARGLLQRGDFIEVIDMSTEVSTRRDRRRAPDVYELSRCASSPNIEMNLE
jgi:hypothetical protein